MKSELFSKFSKICFIFMILIYKQKFPKIQTIKTYFKDIPYSYYENYINDCYKLKKYRRKKINNKIPYFSICFATYNMENYIESTILSIMNQSFQDFEIIIVNDFSNDNTLNIINKIKNKKIKVINHSQNLGVLTSRIDCILNSSGKYLILMDPDDLILEPNLFEYLYNYNLRYNLDIIEFTMLSYLEKTKYLHKEEFYYHYHNFSENIIYQPQLSNLFFYIPNTKKYTDIVCQSSRNKIFRKELLLKTVKYLGNDYYKEFFITAEDTLISLISYQFANNYSNINYTGYMYNIREKSMTHGQKTIQQKILYNYNYLLFNKILYKLIKDFNKDLNFLFYDLKKRTNYLLLQLKKFSTKLKLEVNEFYKEVRNNTNISKEFNNFIYNSLIK